MSEYFVSLRCIVSQPAMSHPLKPHCNGRSEQGCVARKHSRPIPYYVLTLKLQKSASVPSLRTIPLFSQQEGSVSCEHCLIIPRMSSSGKYRLERPCRPKTNVSPSSATNAP
ncbi:hypothetical protein PISMIDRAFT_679098 [Pisolithus microcarpus 441]|uniref:Unplaced genomic scaffold scaffold_40, whole genome shotgun sequence n=1 Tax=Pisolithus microcarpus 441 TaxID=765257 RepID=A0A0C9ZCI8_9AGAM|nr:hypothetical protein PISMIDRAFT_679098 [Pisolithus microcarpus 441]